MIVPIVPSSAEGGGNTISPPLKQSSPAIRWCFTLNNYSEDEFSSICSKLHETCKVACVGKEIGESGTPHLQGYLEFSNKSRPISVFKNICNKIHFEKSKGSKEDNLKYCSKENLVYTLGFPKPIKIITNLYPFQLHIETIIQTTPDDRSIYWFWESIGNFGKSAFIKYCVVKHNVLYINGGKYSDIMNLIFNADMDKCNCVMIDIPRSNRGCISYASLESIKNGLVCNTKYETGSKVFNSPHLIIFANSPPECEYKLSADRWKITNLRGEDDISLFASLSNDDDEL